MASKMRFTVTVEIVVRPCSSVDTVEAVQERLEQVVAEKLDTCTLDDFYTVASVNSQWWPEGK